MIEEQREVRGIQLLEGEDLWLTLHTRSGMVDKVPAQEDCVVLTSQRLMGFAREDARRRGVLIPLQNVDAVEVAHPARSLRPLVTGVALAIAGLIVVWLATVLGVLGILSWLIAGTMVLLGAVTASPYFVAEEPPVITFRSRTSEVALPLRTPQALRDAYSLANGFFRARAGEAPKPAQGPYPYPLEMAPLVKEADPQAASTEAPAAVAPPPTEESPQAQRGQDV